MHSYSRLHRTILTSSALALAAAVATVTGCSGQAQSDSDVAHSGDELRAVVGAQGAELTGPAGSSLEGVHVVIPPGAVSSDTEVRIKLATNPPALPQTALACGKTFDIEPAGLALAVPATVTLPFDPSVVAAHDRFADEVKVWVRDGDHWSQRKQIDDSDTGVTIALPAFTELAAGVNPPKPGDVVHFRLVPNPKFLPCLAAHPDDPDQQPRADVTVIRGELNDTLRLRASGLKPGLKFDMFTVEHSSLGPDGKPDPAFSGFGLAWYQSDVDARNDGRARVDIRTILLDQIFGFDPAANLPPTGTFHVGFWFNDPNDAAACGFDPSKPTPFNGDHEAGPLAMISVPDETSGLGPLCTHPDTSTTPARCSP